MQFAGAVLQGAHPVTVYPGLVSVVLSVENVGPVRRGRLSLSDLTVLIGPNNAGKSVLATVLYAARRATYHGVSPGVRRRVVVPSHLRLTDADLKRSRVLARYIEDSSALPKTLPEDAQSAVLALVDRYLSQVGKSFLQETERAFGQELATLARYSEDGKQAPLRLSITSQSPAWSISLQASPGRTSRPKVTHRHNVSPRSILQSLRSAVDREAQQRTSFGNAIAEYRHPFVSQYIGAYLGQPFVGATYYLPAARSGFLQSHRALASFVIDRAPLAGIEPMEVPQMTGVVADFISTLLRLQDRRVSRSLSAVADDLESNVIQGPIKVRRGTAGYPEIEYDIGTTELPLYRTSSMVSELAPISLYLRHLVRRGDLLIIEEPESHLHPESQRWLAYTLVNLVNAGVRLVLTTHSDYFLRQLNNAIKRWAVSHVSDQSEALDPAQVAGILVRPSRLGGSTTVPLRIDKNDGIPETEFGRVAEKLYAESVVLEDRMAQLDNAPSRS